ncbi:MAG: SDR family NAD(P)-dependent oxidoreductase, partial [Flavisolibacter sp.]|nr:SDR family NAD(P)-dependent oxidoreductase [Flavisolibacter sp.]
MKRFEGQVAVISGGADGLGKGIAERIASEGGTVALFDMNKPLLDRTVEEFKNKGFEASGYVVDISLEKTVSQSLQQVDLDAFPEFGLPCSVDVCMKWWAEGVTAE